MEDPKLSNQVQQDVIIVGGGLAGLSCGVLLAEAGKSVRILEATDKVGGRVRSDVIDGFTLDVGFQVLLTAYPACRQLLNYDALRLRPFDPGALIRQSGQFTTLADPWRRPSRAIATAFNPVGTLGDKLRIAKLRKVCCSGPLDELYQRPAKPTEQYLRDFGFTDRIIDQFFRPFLGGVFLDESLAVSSRMLEFVFRMFSSGDVSVPADGMGAIPRQLAERMPRGSISLQSSVIALDRNQVTLADGTTLLARHIVIATESNGASRLLARPEISTEWNQASTFYYASPRLPEKGKSLILCGDETGPVQTATILSNVAPEYAPSDQTLISVSHASSAEKQRDLDQLDQETRDQLRSWFGDIVSDWRLLQSYQVCFGVPQTQLDPVVQAVRVDCDHPTFVCGDHRETPSIQGAMQSGIRVAESILQGDTGA
ncbi:MAG: NAD(P)/FAD-dependent oxidoreductase [Rubripirellula sp.]